jgi:hypothetical protein
MKKFPSVGFEFTAAMAKGKKISNRALEPSKNEKALDNINRKIKTNNDFPFYVQADISKYKWINDNFQSDECGCEVPTPIIKNKKDVTRCFKEFLSFVKTSNLSIDMDKAKCPLGGCHIHMDTSFMSIPFRTRFIKNVALYMTNHPELNWGFNDPNDIDNANSLLTARYLDDVKKGQEAYDIEASCVDVSVSIINNAMASDILRPYRYDKVPFKAFMSNPLKITLFKTFAFRYNRGYKTIEFRIFDMPKTLKQHLLHYDVAKAIYNICYKKTLKNQLFKQKYDKNRDFAIKPLEVALENFKACMKELHIKPNRTHKMISNMKTRFAWEAILDKNQDSEYSYLF